ncbi:hypothetical protein H257_15996 [Aphanomyces astaci]|uniref:CCHC-type domain-containing protein n=1 Tax=Aphanomyces astaci TaxID=112090 RepID=W4FLU6_APHAT|nr:hypothetical protein H257_15996 [Aphanomyces astaci]ETV67871.1 hypothetical protein H257_15996 [Aphanomyces astaci]|eukprot:XP_009842616.1 hypothetical protein H257_15996 [Aphanomyces astaci]
MLHLKGRADNWAFSKRLTDRHCFPSFAVFETELKAMFLPPNSDFRYRSQYLACKQGKRSLQEPGAHQLFHAYPDTFEEAVRIALSESFSSFAHARAASSDMSVSMLTQASDDRTCFNCGRPGHFSRACPAPRQVASAAPTSHGSSPAAPAAAPVPADPASVLHKPPSVPPTEWPSVVIGKAPLSPPIAASILAATLIEETCYLNKLPRTSSETLAMPEMSFQSLVESLHAHNIAALAMITVEEAMDLFSDDSFEDAFPDEVPCRLPVDKGVQHEIDLVPGAKYCVTRQWPLPRDQVNAIDAFFVARKAAGHVRESISPHSSPTFGVNKPGGKWLLVHAFNKLNAATIPARTPIPCKDGCP